MCNRAMFRLHLSVEKPDSQTYVDANFDISLSAACFMLGIIFQNWFLLSKHISMSSSQSSVISNWEAASSVTKRAFKQSAKWVDEKCYLRSFLFQVIKPFHAT
ncbi:hypothetical protein CHARACLAT_027182 [Characodon lateralis]|uniref:Uncharacterized protein n=1 Tax=Characodon lateralis TaxID=208331 RepID=A0ABU7E3Z0_9TELE|nr:hypothetical protein [Characodon lateralis]